MNRIAKLCLGGFAILMMLGVVASCESENTDHQRHASEDAEDHQHARGDEHTAVHEHGADDLGEHEAGIHIHDETCAHASAHDPGARDDGGHDHDETCTHASAHDLGVRDDDGHDHDDAGHDHDDADHDHPAAAHLVLDPVAARNLGIQTQAVHPQIHYDQVKIPGMIIVDPDREFEISAPATVRVVELDARVPATVRPGERLAVLELADPEIRDLQMEAVAVRARQLADLTEQERLTRYLGSLRAALVPAEAEIERVGADLRVVEARLDAQRSTLDALLAALRTAGLDKQQIQDLADRGRVSTHIAVSVPATPGISSLEVVDRPVHQGQTVPAGATLFRLACLEQLWVKGEAFEADLAVVRRAARDGLPVTLLFPAEDRRVTDLCIVALEGESDGANRVTHFFVELPNELTGERVNAGQRYQEWAHRAGARVQILVATQQVGRRYVIPAGALVREAGQAWVFVKEDGEYLRLPVPVESIGPRRAVLPLDCGLHPGDVLVVRGALQLNLTLDQQQGPQAVDPHAGHSH